MKTLQPVIQSLFATASTRITYAKCGDKEALLKNWNSNTRLDNTIESNFQFQSGIRLWIKLGYL